MIVLPNRSGLIIVSNSHYLLGQLEKPESLEGSPYKWGLLISTHIEKLDGPNILSEEKC